MQFTMREMSLAVQTLTPLKSQKTDVIEMTVRKNPFKQLFSPKSWRRKKAITPANNWW
jgi:hypothetical protein